jgi:hypothetical protein
MEHEVAGHPDDGPEPSPEGRRGEARAAGGCAGAARPGSVAD